MMVTAEMMEALGGKRGKPRGPDQTHVVVSEETEDSYAGASSLEEAVGTDWEDGLKGRSARKAQKARQKALYDAAYEKLRSANENLNGVVSAIQSYVGGLEEMCDGQAATASTLLNTLSSVEALAEPVREYHDIAMRWCDTSVPTSTCARMQQSLDTMVLQPILAHVELRRDLELRMEKAKKKKDHALALIEEVNVLAEAMPAVVHGPFEALRRCQIDWHSSVAVQMGGGDESSAPSLTAAMTDRGRALTGKTGRTPRSPHASSTGSGGGWDDAESGGLPATPTEPPQATADMWCDPTGLEPWEGLYLSDIVEFDRTNPCLWFCGVFGWFEQRPCLFVALKNVSSLEVTDIKVELVKSSIGISFHHPLELERMAPGQEARCRTTLTLSEGAFQLEGGGTDGEKSKKSMKQGGSVDDFDSFFGERDDDISFAPENKERRTIGSWATDPACASLKSELRLTSSVESTLVEMCVPYQLLLQGVGDSLCWSEFQRLWQDIDAVAAAAVVSGGSGDGGTEEPDDGTTKLCIRVEDPPEILGYARYDPDTLLDVVRSSLLADPSLAPKMPAEWVFVKKGAPVGKKAESKWRVGDIVPNAVLRNKSKGKGNGGGPLPTNAQVAAVGGSGEGSAASVCSAAYSGGGDALDSGISGVATGAAPAKAKEHKFVANSTMADEIVARTLQIGGMSLVGRVEVSKTEAQMLFYVRADGNIFFLLQVSSTVDPGTQDPRCTGTYNGITQSRELQCAIRGSEPSLFATLETAVCSLLLGKGNFHSSQPFPGAGQPFYGDFGGVSLQDAQESAEPDEGYCYNDYSTREMSPGAVAHDWLCRNGYEVQAESVLAAMRAGGVGVDGWMRRLIQMKQKEEELVQKSRSRNSSQASDFSDLQTQLQQAAPLVLGAAPGLLRTQRPDKARGQDDDKNVTNATLPVAALELDGGLESFVEAAHAKYGQPAPKEGGANGLGGPNGGGSVFSGSDDHGFGSSSRSHSNPGVKGRRRPSVGSEGAGSRGHHRHPSSESGGQGGYDYGDFGGVSSHDGQSQFDGSSTGVARLQLEGAVDDDFFLGSAGQGASSDDVSFGVFSDAGASGGGVGISEGMPPRIPSRTNSAGNHSDYGGGGSSVYSADLSPPGGSSNAGGLERGSQSGGGYGAEGGFDADFETLSGGAPNSGVFDADYINSAQQQTVLDDGGAGGTFMVNSEGGRMNSPFSNSTNFQSNYGGLSPGGGGLPNVSLSGTAEALLALSKPDPELLLGISEEGVPRFDGGFDAIDESTLEEQQHESSVAGGIGSPKMSDYD